MDVSLAHLRSAVWPALERVYGLPSGLLNAIATVETGGTFNARAYNNASGAAGLFQLTPIALEQVRLDTGVRFDPMSPGAASGAAALLLRRYLRMFRGDVNLALAAYNAGEGAVKRFLIQVQTQGVGRLPRETANYIPKVLEVL